MKRLRGKRDHDACSRAVHKTAAALPSPRKKDEEEEEEEE